MIHALDTFFLLLHWVIVVINSLWALLYAEEIWFDFSFSEVIQKQCLSKAGLARRECLGSGEVFCSGLRPHTGFIRCSTHYNLQLIN